jgi:hypothetical protein
MERLAEALDNHDRRGLALVSGCLAKDAEHCSEGRLAEAATALEEAASGDSELEDVARLTADVMSLCRATQSAFVRNAVLKEGVLEESAV